MTLPEVYVQFKTIVTKERVTRDLAMLALGNPLRISLLAQIVRKVIFVKVMALKFHVQRLTIAMATSVILLGSYAQEDSMVAKLRQAFMKSRTVLLVQLLHSAKAEDSLGNVLLGMFVNQSLILQHQLIWIWKDLEKLIPVQLVIGVHKEHKNQILALLATLPERPEAGKKRIAVFAQSDITVITFILRHRIVPQVTIARLVHMKP